MDTAMTSIYHIQLKVSACRARLLLNGFPLIELKAGGKPRVSMLPVNLWLVGADNLLEVGVHPEGENSMQWAAASVDVDVRCFAKGGVVGPGSENSILSLTIPRLLRQGPGPWSFSQRFSTIDAPSFDTRLLHAPPVRDEVGLRNYALYIRNLVASDDANGLLEQMRPKLEDYARAFGEATHAFEADFREFLSEELFPARPALDFEYEDLVLRPCCGARIWELCRRTGGPLISITSNKERRDLSVFVGSYNGMLKIVR